MLGLPPGNNTQLPFSSVIWNTSFLTPNWLWINRLQPCQNPFLYLSSMEMFVFSLKQWLSPEVFLPGQIIFCGFPYNQIWYVFPRITYLHGFQPMQYLQCWLKAMFFVAKAIRGLVPALWKSRIFDLWTAASALHSRAHSGWRLRVSVSNKGIWLQNSTSEEHKIWSLLEHSQSFLSETEFPSFLSPRWQPKKQSSEHSAH